MTNRPRRGRTPSGVAWQAALAVCAATWLSGLASAQDTNPRPRFLPATVESQASAPKPSKPAAESEPIVDPAVVRIGCSSCSNGLLGPPTHDDSHYIGPGPTGCGTGQCVPGLKKCYCADCSQCETYFGRLMCGFYDCICCPDPCYEPHWCPLQDMAFFQDAPRPQTQTRFRYESGWNFQNPDRAEWFRARTNTQPTQAQPGVNTPGFGAGKGPPYIVESVDYQAFHMYTEAATGSFGFFTDIAYQSNSPKTAPVAFTLLEQQRQQLQPQLNQNQQQLNQNQQQQGQAQNQQQLQQLQQQRQNLLRQRQNLVQQQQNLGVLTGGESGFADMTLGTKSVLIDCELLLTTFQFKVFLPTGTFTKGIGTGHTSLEPSLLFAIKLLPNLYVQGQLAYWFPVGGDQLYEGNVFHAHLAFNRELWEPCPGTRLVGTFETNFWNVFNGAFTSPDILIPNPARANDPNAPALAPVALPAEASIVSMGPGVRFFCCDRVDTGIGSAIAVTGNRWEKQVLRVDFRWRF